MPQEYTCKTQRGSTPDILQCAADAVRGGHSLRSAAATFGVDQMTLTGFMTKQQENPPV
ncbi:hypothetical protein HOLleu_17216 [Holothuria leucospilota]|uniref:HTH psq-type domain-containing protein n=1 Tax=Holothuria leucospilota TaxID=206669 RepID=A0A9Q1HB50_HOLLE|nr:hypothetical protein HOLleu_17216 [Holothuria leucospilota]